jgi:hypothetical protein
MPSSLACVRLDFGGAVSAHFAQQTTGTGAVAHLAWVALSSGTLNFEALDSPPGERHLSQAKPPPELPVSGLARSLSSLFRHQARPCAGSRTWYEAALA